MVQPRSYLLISATPLAPSTILLVAATTATLVAAAALAVATSSVAALLASASVLSIWSCKMLRVNFYTLLQ